MNIADEILMAASGWIALIALGVLGFRRGGVATNEILQTIAAGFIILIAGVVIATAGCSRQQPTAHIPRDPSPPVSCFCRHDCDCWQEGGQCGCIIVRKLAIQVEENELRLSAIEQAAGVCQ